MNPRRSMLSSFTLISLIGVMLGVLVLVVVMAVYAGLERNVKGRILGFTPHILMKRNEMVVGADGGHRWQDDLEMARKLPGVASATAHVSDHVILDMESYQRPVLFYGVDGQDRRQMEGIEKMLDVTHYPASTADIGLDNRVVMSSTLAELLGIGVGDRVRLYSTRNFEEVMRAYKATERPVMREAFRDEWQATVAAMNQGWKQEGKGWVMGFDVWRSVYQSLLGLSEEGVREVEKDMLVRMMVAMDESEKDEGAKVFRFTAEMKAEMESAQKGLQTSDVEKMDAEALKDLKKIVLPKEVEICGVYQASQMAVTPDLFVPMALAQNLAGLDGSVQGIALRLEDAYQAEVVASRLRGQMGDAWRMMTWGEQYQNFFALINQQRWMMYFALSFIVLVSAFSMMAVMFTVTIQKKREIGVMKALGAAPGQIVRVFLYQGMILGVIGSVLGVGLGHVVIYFRGDVQRACREFGFDPFAAGFTGFDVLPAHHDPKEQLVIALMAFILCSLSALVPAFFAARSDAAKSLRNL